MKTKAQEMLDLIDNNEDDSYYSRSMNAEVSPKLSAAISSAIDKVAPDFKYSVRMAPFGGGISAYITVKNWPDFAEYAKKWDPDFDDIWDVKSWKKIEAMFDKIIAAVDFKSIKKEFPGFDSTSVHFDFVSPSGDPLGESL